MRNRRVKVDASLYAGGSAFAAARLSTVGAAGRQREVQGFDGGFVLDGVVDPFLALSTAATATSRLDLLSGVAIAFARSPIITALQAWNLQELSSGRFTMGLGSQVRAHIEKRFSMPWGAPAAKMREYVLAVRAIWDCWGRGRRLEFRGEFYTHTLMTPTFNPGPIGFDDPRLLVGALGPRMLAVAGEVADGVYGHPFTTAEYVSRVQLPAIERGLEKRSPELSDEVTVTAMPMIVTGATADDRARAASAVRRQCAFYGSTPAYYSVLEFHGRGDLGPRLNEMSKRGEWDLMAELWDDDLLDLFAVQGTPEEIPAKLLDRAGTATDRIELYAPYETDSVLWQDIARAMRRLQAVPSSDLAGRGERERDGRHGDR